MAEQATAKPANSATYLTIISIICGVVGLFILGTILGATGAFMGYGAIKLGSRLGYIGLVFGVLVFILAIISIILY